MTAKAKSKKKSANKYVSFPTPKVPLPQPMEPHEAVWYFTGDEQKDFMRTDEAGKRFAIALAIARRELISWGNDVETLTSIVSLMQAYFKIDGTRQHKGSDAGKRVYEPMFKELIQLARKIQFQRPPREVGSANFIYAKSEKTND